MMAFLTHYFKVRNAMVIVGIYISASWVAGAAAGGIVVTSRRSSMRNSTRSKRKNCSRSTRARKQQPNEDKDLAMGNGSLSHSIRVQTSHFSSVLNMNTHTTAPCRLKRVESCNHSTNKPVRRVCCYLFGHTSASAARPYHALLPALRPTAAHEEAPLVAPEQIETVSRTSFG